MTIYQGWTPPNEKKCIRCGAMHVNQLYLLCDVCREGDKLADYFNDPRTDEERELDRLDRETRETINSVKPGP